MITSTAAPIPSSARIRSPILPARSLILTKRIGTRDTEQANTIPGRTPEGRIRMRKVVVLLLSALGLTAMLALFLFHPYVPAEATALATRFVEDLQDGRIDDAYALTDRGADVGENVHAFAANEDVVALSSSRHPVTLVGVRPTMSRARRIVGIIRGHRIEPDFLYVDFQVGFPYLVRLRHTQCGWAVSYFEVHAE